jgi:hypothetical protein
MHAIARALVFAAVLSAVGCGSSKHAAEPRTVTVTTVTTAPASQPATTQAEAEQTPAPAYRVYFLRNDKLAAAGRAGTSTRAPARAAMQELLAGPTPREEALGMTSAIPAGERLTRLEIRNGAAIADFDPIVSPDSPGFAQIVYTLTQFPTVKRVSIVLETQDAAEFTRAAVERFAPAIVVEAPTPDERISSPLRIRGTANTFEAEFRYELRDGSGSVIASGGVTATSGSGQRGTFDKTIRFSGTARELRVFELSAADGSRIHEVRIPLTS